VQGSAVPLLQLPPAIRPVLRSLFPAVKVIAQVKLVRNVIGELLTGAVTERIGGGRMPNSSQRV
jgi:hypothetical protein